MQTHLGRPLIQVKRRCGESPAGPFLQPHSKPTQRLFYLRQIWRHSFMTSNYWDRTTDLIKRRQYTKPLEWHTYIYDNDRVQAFRQSVTKACHIPVSLRDYIAQSECRNTGLQANCLLSSVGFNQNWKDFTIFRKLQHYDSWKSVQPFSFFSRVWTEWQSYFTGRSVSILKTRWWKF